MEVIKKGSTDVSVELLILDATTGEPKTDVVYNSSGLDLWYRRKGAATASITEASLANASAAHADGGFIHIDDGVYRLDLPDVACATGVSGLVVGGAVTGGVILPLKIQLVDLELRDFTDHYGTAQAGAAGTITLASEASSTDDYYNGAVVKIVSGTGAGQSRQIIDYVGSTRVATVDANWVTNPSSDSVYIVIGRIV